MTYSEIKSLLLGISDPVMRLEAVMDIGRQLPPIPRGKKGVEIKGCSSHVEIWRDNRGRLHGSTDSALVRGIAAVLVSMKEAGADLDDFPKLGLGLGAARLNGAASMIEYLRSI
jgi:sulfur transfer protein SufE